MLEANLLGNKEERKINMLVCLLERVASDIFQLQTISFVRNLLPIDFSGGCLIFLIILTLELFRSKPLTQKVTRSYTFVIQQRNRFFVSHASHR